LGLPLWRTGSWPFAGADLRDLRCVQRAFACSLAVHHRALTLRSDRGLRGPHHSGRCVGSFLLASPCPWSSCRLSRATVSFRSTVRSRSLAGPLASGFAASPGVVQRSPLHRSTLPESTPGPGPAPHLRGPRPGAFEAGVATALSRDPPSFRPRRLYDLAGFLLLQAAGVLHPAPILGFAAFPSASALASASFPAARFLPFEAFLPAVRCPLRSRDGCGGSSPLRRCRRTVHRAPSLLVLTTPLARPRRTSRVFSTCGAVPPCAVSSADGPLLPWACQSCD